MLIENVNTGLCHRRTQEGKPAFFVNWQENGQNMYSFFALPSSCETLKNRLINQSNTPVTHGN